MKSSVSQAEHTERYSLGKNSRGIQELHRNCKGSKPDQAAELASE